MSVYTREEVAKHNKPEDLWIIIDNVVLDLTKFVSFHPGGATVLHDVAGQDATEEFYSLHRQEVLIKYLNKYKIGTIAHETAKIEIRQPGAISKVPYAEQSFWMGLHSPYFNDSHLKFRDAVRKFYDENVVPEAAASEESGKVPSSELYQKMGAFGIWLSRVGPGPWVKMAVESGVCTLPGGVNPDEFDYFHELIAHEESIRIGYPSFADSLGAGLVIGLPPVLNFGSDELRARVIPEVLSGKKRICLAISEPTAGSDVANIKTTATKTPDGKFFVVNGVKKWITNGTFCDYFSTAVRTENGISMLLIERSEGLETESIKTSYSSSAGTAYITFENVKVPVENLLGKEGKGFKVIMFNFNHERWTINCAAIRASRFIVEESFKWAAQRKVFGKPLLSQPVIRNKLARMVAQLESVSNWHENITYQMCKMSYLDQSKYLAGPIALCKYQATRVAYSISDDACQIFGGRAITRTGMGRVIESFQRTIKYGAILGGSEEIMADLGIRQAIKDMPNAKL